ncbi:mucin-2-like [Ambystoma mexicanum]|uniref:mucin-2-like n=1 Tax=Ambystoma mexicanum TaxID=8296 RepID=UPI0037E93BEF
MKVLLRLALLLAWVGRTFSGDAESANFCHQMDATMTLKGAYPGSTFVACSCKAGYFGNGFSCTPPDKCTSELCCSPMTTWSNTTRRCIDVDECRDLTLNQCTPQSTCSNYFGNHLCSLSRQVICDSTTCDDFRDCLSNQCGDPCTNYKSINGNTRLSSIYSTGMFTTDQYLFGWYRYIGFTGVRMQEGCTGPVRCGSGEPFTLEEGGHPLLGSGIKAVRLLANKVTGPCTPSGTILVKACQKPAGDQSFNGFYIYKFTGSLFSEVFCTDPETTSLTPIPEATTIAALKQAPMTTVTQKTTETTTTSQTTTALETKAQKTTIKKPTENMKKVKKDTRDMKIAEAKTAPRIPRAKPRKTTRAITIQTLKTETKPETITTEASASKAVLTSTINKKQFSTKKTLTSVATKKPTKNMKKVKKDTRDMKIAETKTARKIPRIKPRKTTRAITIQTSKTETKPETMTIKANALTAVLTSTINKQQFSTKKTLTGVAIKKPTKNMKKVKKDTRDMKIAETKTARRIPRRKPRKTTRAITIQTSKTETKPEKMIIEARASTAVLISTINKQQFSTKKTLTRVAIKKPTKNMKKVKKDTLDMKIAETKTARRIPRRKPRKTTRAITIQTSKTETKPEKMIIEARASTAVLTSTINTQKSSTKKTLTRVVIKKPTKNIKKVKKDTRDMKIAETKTAPRIPRAKPRKTTRAITIQTSKTESKPETMTIEARASTAVLTSTINTQQSSTNQTLTRVAIKKPAENMKNIKKDTRDMEIAETAPIKTAAKPRNATTATTIQSSTAETKTKTLTTKARPSTAVSTSVNKTQKFSTNQTLTSVEINKPTENMKKVKKDTRDMKIAETKTAHLKPEPKPLKKTQASRIQTSPTETKTKTMTTKAKASAPVSRSTINIQQSSTNQTSTSVAINKPTENMKKVKKDTWEMKIAEAPDTSTPTPTGTDDLSPDTSELDSRTQEELTPDDLTSNSLTPQEVTPVDSTDDILITTESSLDDSSSDEIVVSTPIMPTHSTRKTVDQRRKSSRLDSATGDSAVPQDLKLNIAPFYGSTSDDVEDTSTLNGSTRTSATPVTDSETGMKEKIKVRGIASKPVQSTSSMRRMPTITIIQTETETKIITTAEMRNVKAMPTTKIIIKEITRINTTVTVITREKTKMTTLLSSSVSTTTITIDSSGAVDTSNTTEHSLVAQEVENYNDRKQQQQVPSCPFLHVPVSTVTTSETNSAPLDGGTNTTTIYVTVSKQITTQVAYPQPVDHKKAILHLDQDS